MIRINSRVLLFFLIGISFLAMVGLGLFQKMQASENAPSTQQESAAPTKIQPKVTASYGKLPLSFEVSQGQTNAQVRFLARGRGYTLFLTADGATLTPSKDVAPTFRSAHAHVAQHPSFGASALQDHLLASRLNLENGLGKKDVEKPQDRRAGPALRMRLEGANPRAVVTGADELPGKANYFIGNDPKKWRTNVPTYARVKYQGVYPGIDLVYYGNQGGQLEYDFVVTPGADPSAIALDVGAVREPPRAHRDAPLQIAGDGDLVIPTDGADVRLHKPVVYQEQSIVDSQQLRVQDEIRNSKLESRNSGNHKSPITNRKSVEARFVLTAPNQVRFAVGPYDHTRPLVIDPLLVYSTYLGGSKEDTAAGVAVDSSGNAYVTGATYSTDFPTANPLQATNKATPATANPTAFVAKLNSTGSALVYSTYLGGSGWDEAFAIAVDSSGNAYVTGFTASYDFPTVNALQTTNYNIGRGNAFVTKLNAVGSALVYSTYLGGSDGNPGSGYGIAVDSSGNAYVTGQTMSTDFPTVNPLQATLHAFSGNAFVAKFNAAGTALVYSTYLGGSKEDQGNGIAVDSSGNADVTGTTWSTDFPTASPLQASNKATPTTGGPTAFVAKLNSTGSALVYSTYLGGTTTDQGYGIAVDSSGNAYVTGYTESTDFPTVTPIQAACGGSALTCYDAFVAKLTAAGSALVYSTYLGGSGSDAAQSIAVDSSGNAYVTGGTTSTDFPLASPFQATNKVAATYPNQLTAFVAEVYSTGSALVFSSYLGGSVLDAGRGIAVDSSGNAYVTGGTASLDFPTVNPLQPSNHGVTDAFVARISMGGAAPLVSLAPTSLTFGPQNVDTSSAAQTVTVINTGTANLTISTVTAGGANAGDFATSADTCAGATVTPNSTCTVSVTFTPSATGSRSASLIFADNASNSPQTVSLTGEGGSAPPVAGVSPSSLTFGNEGVGTTSAPQSVTLSNSGEAALTITSISTPASFGQTNNCAGIVAGDSSCSINVTFSPTAAAAYNGALTITDNSNGVTGSTQSVALSGTGQDFTLAVAAGSSASATVAPGQTATYILSVTPGQGGFNQSISFTNYVCLVPAGANCTFSPNPVTPGSSAANVALTVTTTAPSVSAPRSRRYPPVRPHSPGPGLLLMLALILAAMVWAVARWNQPGASRWQSSIVPLVSGLLLAVALAGCGGGTGGVGSGGGGGTQNTGTPHGTFPFTITGVAGAGSSALSHSLTLTLTVS